MSDLPDGSADEWGRVKELEAENERLRSDNACYNAENRSLAGDIRDLRIEYRKVMREDERRREALTRIMDCDSAAHSRALAAEALRVDDTKLIRGRIVHGDDD